MQKFNYSDKFKLINDSLGLFKKQLVIYNIYSVSILCKLFLIICNLKGNFYFFFNF